MTPEYQAFRDELLEQALSRYIQPRDTISIPYLLKGKCSPWTLLFVARFPELTRVAGFYNGAEHFWCVDQSGAIVDPTVEQFYVPAWSWNPLAYRVYDPETDEVFLGKCMNCGSEIYGLISEGQQSVCRDAESDCQAQLEDYYNDLTRGARA